MDDRTIDVTAALEQLNADIADARREKKQAEERLIYLMTLRDALMIAVRQSQQQPVMTNGVEEGRAF